LENTDSDSKVVVSHEATDKMDKVEATGKSHAEALAKLLELRGVTDIKDLKPPVISTRWC
jgi:hypothetical protein